jgi:ATP adenylyltransferase
MDKLWAPWRYSYVSKKHHKGCIFCHAAKSSKDLVVFKTKHSLVLLNIFPYNNGHLMVAPIRHTKDLDTLTPDEAMDIFENIKRAQKLLKKVLKAEAFNLGVNLGRSAGAGITGHLHIHIVPRWYGDTNFMPTVFSTKVISQSLRELHKRLKDAYAKKNKRN